jgi:hypothetical protein
MAAIYSNGGNHWNILGFNFTKRDALSSVYKKSMVLPGLKITACQRTISGQKCLFPGHFFTSPVILTGHIFMPSNVIADVLN